MIRVTRIGALLGIVFTMLAGLLVAPASAATCQTHYGHWQLKQSGTAVGYADANFNVCGSGTTVTDVDVSPAAGLTNTGRNAGWNFSVYNVTVTSKTSSSWRYLVQYSGHNCRPSCTNIRFSVTIDARSPGFTGPYVPYGTMKKDSGSANLTFTRT